MLLHHRPFRCGGLDAQVLNGGCACSGMYLHTHICTYMSMDAFVQLALTKAKGLGPAYTDTTLRVMDKNPSSRLYFRDKASSIRPRHLVGTRNAVEACKSRVPAPLDKN